MSRRKRGLEAPEGPPCWGCAAPRGGPEALLVRLLGAGWESGGTEPLNQGSGHTCLMCIFSDCTGGGHPDVGVTMATALGWTVAQDRCVNVNMGLSPDMLGGLCRSRVQCVPSTALGTGRRGCFHTWGGSGRRSPHGTPQSTPVLAWPSLGPVETAASAWPPKAAMTPPALHQQQVWGAPSFWVDLGPLWSPCPWLDRAVGGTPSLGGDLGTMVLMTRIVENSSQPHRSLPTAPHPPAHVSPFLG